MNDIDKQRNIGKQIMMAKVVKTEKEEAERTGLSLLRIDRLAEWTSMSEDEVKEFIKTCKSLEKREMAYEAACRFNNNAVISPNMDMLSFPIFTYSQVENELLRGYSPEQLLRYCDDYVKENSALFSEKCGRQVDDYFSIESFKLLLENYLKYFTSTVNAICNKGYDWDVISEMLWCDISKSDYDLLAKEYL